jgi:hypothetical protein
MIFVEWAVIGLCFIWTVSTNIALRQHYKNSDKPALPANATAMTQVTSFVVVAAVGCSPFYLPLLIPISYLSGFIALRSKTFGRLAWLYGHEIAYTVPANW